MTQRIALQPITPNQQPQRTPTSKTSCRQIDNVATRIEDVGKRIDAANERLAEIQRQTAAIEGKLGDSKPNRN